MAYWFDRRDATDGTTHSTYFLEFFLHRSGIRKIDDVVDVIQSNTIQTPFNFVSRDRYIRIRYPRRQFPTVQSVLVILVNFCGRRK